MKVNLLYVPLNVTLYWAMLHTATVLNSGFVKQYLHRNHISRAMLDQGQGLNESENSLQKSIFERPWFLGLLTLLKKILPARNVCFWKKSGQQFCVQQKLPDPSDNIFDLIFFVCENQHWTVKDFQGRKKFSSIPHRFR